MSGWVLWWQAVEFDLRQTHLLPMLFTVRTLKGSVEAPMPRKPTPMLSPDPVSPTLPWPKHLTCPLSSTTHVCWPPQLTYLAVRPVPRLTVPRLSISLAMLPM